jgi:hypothetical protein
MLIRPPAVSFPRGDGELAPRLPALRGARVAFVDGWGCKLHDGSTGMYPTMEELARLLRERASIGSVTWLHKDTISRPESPESIARLSREFDLVINGEGL